MVGKATRSNKGSNKTLDSRIPDAPDSLPMVIWIPIYHGMATLHDMRNKYSIKDCFMFIEAIEYKAKVDSVHEKIAREKAKVK